MHQEEIVANANASDDGEGLAMGCLLLILFVVVELLSIGVGVVLWGFGGFFIGIAAGVIIWFLFCALPCFLWDTRKSRRS